MDGSDAFNRLRRHSFLYCFFDILSSPKGEIEWSRKCGGNPGTPPSLESVLFKRPGNGSSVRWLAGRQ